jgi:hypothetical protein
MHEAIIRVDISEPKISLHLLWLGLRRPEIVLATYVQVFQATARVARCPAVDLGRRGGDQPGAVDTRRVGGAGRLERRELIVFDEQGALNFLSESAEGQTTDSRQAGADQR